jgi:hypothetical protein
LTWIPRRAGKKIKELSIDPKICFILGVSQRSGTNFLYRILNLHPHCAGPGPIWEDCFLYHSETLAAFTEGMYKQWDSTWEVEEKLGGSPLLLRCLGGAIENFLRRQLSPRGEKITESQGRSKPNQIKVLLTKTPTALGLHHFWDLFPDAKLILLVRDGRAVVESMTVSFGASSEDAMRTWRDNAKRIHAFRSEHENKTNKFLVLKYEDIMEDERSSLLQILEFLELDTDLFDFDALQSLGVTGSSEAKKKDGVVHWQRQEKTSDFNPLARADHWSQQRHERFNWVAGKQMEDLGYQLKPITTSQSIHCLKNTIKDIGISIYRSSVSTLRCVYRYFKDRYRK